MHIPDEVFELFREMAEKVIGVVEPYDTYKLEPPPVDSNRDYMLDRQAEARVFAPQRAAARARAFAREMVAEKAREALRRRKWALRIDYWPEDTEHGEIRALFCLKKSSENLKKGVDISHNV